MNPKWIISFCWMAVILIFLQSPVTQGALQSDYYNLIDHLFTDYRTEVRPVSDDSNATDVGVAFWLQSIVDLDEKNQVLATAAVIQMHWFDQYMTWNPSDYGSISKLRYPQSKLWLPDVIVSNSVQSQSHLGYKESPCAISSYGLVDWRPSEILETSCDMDVTYYPFDEQECSIVISTWISASDDIILSFYEDSEIILDRYSPSGTWDLVSTSLQTLPDDEGLSRLQYNFRLKRLSTFYVLNIILPILLLSITASAVFYLPAQSGEKIGLSMTVLLAFAVYLTIIADNMPQTSLQVSILSVYCTILLGICGMSVFMSVFVLHLHHYPPEQPMGKRTRAFTKKLRKYLCTGHRHHKRKGKCTVDSPDNQCNKRTVKVSPLVVTNGTDQKKPYNEETFNADDEEEYITWPVVAQTIDNVFFLITSLLILFVTVIAMSILIHGG